MGWTSTYREKGFSNFDWFSNEINHKGEMVDQELLACATVGGTCYMAIRFSFHGMAMFVPPDWVAGYIRESDGSVIVGRVALTRWNPKAKDGYNFSWKHIGEESGPLESQCPEKIISMLSNLVDCESSLFAIKWRARCVEHAKRMKAKAKAKVGDIVYFERSFQFSTHSGLPIESKRFKIHAPYIKGFSRRYTIVDANGIDTGIQVNLPRWAFTRNKFEIHTS